MPTATTTPQPTKPRRWAKPGEASTYAKIPVATLASLRCREPGRIPFHRFGKSILYDLNEVDAVLAGIA